MCIFVLTVFLCGCFSIANLHCSNSKLFLNFLDIGKQAEDFMKKGALVPDSIMQKMIIDAMKGLKGQTWLLDGKFTTFLLVYLVCLFISKWVFTFKTTLHFTLMVMALMAVMLTRTEPRRTRTGPNPQ